MESGFPPTSSLIPPTSSSSDWSNWDMVYNEKVEHVLSGAKFKPLKSSFSLVPHIETSVKESMKYLYFS